MTQGCYLHFNFYKIQPLRDDVLQSEESFPCQFISVRKLRIKIIEHLQYRCANGDLPFFERYNQAKLFDQLYELFEVSFPIRLHNPGFCDICAQQLEFPAIYHFSMTISLNFIRQMKEFLEEKMPQKEKLVLIANRLKRIRFQCDQVYPPCQLIFKFALKDVLQIFMTDYMRR